MSEPAPHVLRRILGLRRVPELAAATLGELAALAENAEDVWFAAGSRVHERGARANAIHVVLSGGLATGDQRSEPFQLWGLVDVLAKAARPAPVVAVAETRAIRLAGRDFVEVLEDNFGLLVLVLRDLAAQLAARAASAPRHALPFGTFSHPLGMVERLIVLRTLAPFATARLQALASLAQLSEEVQWPTGGVIARAGTAVDSLLVVLDGAAVARDGDGQTSAVHAGHAIAGLEALAGTWHPATVEATTPVRALRTGTSALLDVLEDHVDLGLAILTRIAAALVETPAPRWPRAAS